MTNNYTELATFAGGCFWCMVKPFDEMDGIEKVVSGYTGGDTKNPTYEDIKKGNTGHYEAVQIEFDPKVFPYEKLLELYWPQIDPTDNEGQFFDRGSQYRTAIFYHTEEQHKLAQESKEQLAKSGRYKKQIVTEIKKAETFYDAEEYHQKFYKKNPEKYKQEREESGRNAHIKKYWGEQYTK
ncbi:peptide-methionine (S)-S-oxide reductase MsrA [Sutcliffiella rhizosphaerae]|uniref:Peptide methionine sulfoxide reductase MsrA n=1 Tax=Sutcliffiella rhizosphaerae TaxID=2880967 RepID=A0ABN8AD83_9BACI|nr:peptide-methionine (S)-S-oxide reductase MsrA [Sutcliffiella rhizosphaerae]CAG9621672.1 Peptide methionine sulfoxide reductase MsrA [Sutcliffiella rhizosphaerae]